MADTELSAAELRDLGEVAGTMVPADAALGMPGADDPAILADAARSVGRDLPLVREALAAIKAKAAGNFAGLDRRHMALGTRLDQCAHHGHTQRASAAGDDNVAIF